MLNQHHFHSFATGYYAVSKLRIYSQQIYLFTLKGYVRTRSRPEGSIAEGYWLEECVTFCSRYLNNDVETKLNRPFRLDDGGDSTRNSVQKLYEEGDEALSEEIISLAMGPLKKAERYTGYVINGFKYHTKARESNRITQHSGVMVKANTDSYASARDMNPIAGDSSIQKRKKWKLPSKSTVPSSRFKALT
ncbi:hypothetical protein RJ640_010653 [Escallonia rubra]|uniref:DUF4218 domain-containing protein n=1 Tax=Escallonia rubra TaxID=112253 RepID=A0AA88QZ83_9ASTE|nr:hypothetical protein RJ640_010653 [Escallonia rubra]